MTDDNRMWAADALDMAYTPKLTGEERETAISTVLRYFEDAAAKGFSG